MQNLTYIKTQLFRFLISILILLISGIQYELSAQDQPKVKIISKKVGESIDADERIEYELFDEYADNFKEAQFYERTDKSKILAIHFKDETKKEILLTQTEYFEYKAQINKRKINYEAIDSTMNCIVKLMDESSISGKIIQVLDKEVVIETNYLDEITIRKNKILEIIFLQSDGKQLNTYWLPNPHDSRHYFAPTARNMKKGEGYFQDIYLVIASVNYAFTNYFTMGGGMSIVPGIGFNQQAYFVNPKLGFEINKNVHLGGGFIYANIGENDSYEIFDSITIPVVLNGQTIGDTTIVHSLDWEDKLIRHNAGILYGVGTYGNRENNLTLGLGYAYLDDDFLKHPVIMIGGMARISRRTAFISENWVFTTYHENEDTYDPYDPDVHKDGYYTTGVISYGIRFFGEKMSVDLAFFQVPGKLGIGEFIFPGIPYLDFVYKF
jgi:hypothetical protein